MPPQPPPQTSLPAPRALLTNLITTLSHPLNNPIPDDPYVLDNPLPAQTLASAKPLLITLHALFPHTLLPALDLLDRRLVARLVYIPPSSSCLPASREHDSGKEGGGGGGGRGGGGRGGGGGVRGDNAGAAAGDEMEREAQEQKQDEGRLSEKKRVVVYYVKSSSSSSSAQQQGRSRSRIYGSNSSRSGEGATWYEVRTKGWSCSCKAFAFGAFRAGVDEMGEYGEQEVDEEEMFLHGGDEEGGNEEWRWGGLMVEEEEDMPLCKHLFACVLAEHWGFAREMVEEREVGRGEMAGWAAGWGD